MKRIVLVVVLVAAATSLMVATSGADVVTHDETDVLELEPAGEGAYTQVDDETGEIRIVLTGENPSLNADGVNDDAVTDIGPVFEIRNVLEAQSTATVWVEDDSEAVAFYTPGGGTVEGESEGVVLEPGQTATVGLRVDTRETDTVSLDGITVKATLEPAVGAAEPPAGADPPADADPPGDPNPPGEPEVLEPGATADSEETATEPAATAEPESTAATATPADTGDAASSSTPDATATPAATATPGERVLLVDGRAEFDTGMVRAVAFDGAPEGWVSTTYRDEPPAEAPSPPGAAIGVVDITVAEGLADRPAAVEFRVTEAQLDGAEPGAVALAHYDDETGEWTTHPAEAERVGPDAYRLTARTDGFSVFAVTVMESAGVVSPATVADVGTDAGGTRTGPPSRETSPWPVGDSPVPLAVLAVALVVAAVAVTRRINR